MKITFTNILRVFIIICSTTVCAGPEKFKYMRATVTDENYIHEYFKSIHHHLQHYGLCRALASLTIRRHSSLSFATFLHLFTPTVL
jgi:hypothetical protein